MWALYLYSYWANSFWCSSAVQRILLDNFHLGELLRMECEYWKPIIWCHFLCRSTWEVISLLSTWQKHFIFVHVYVCQCVSAGLRPPLYLGKYLHVIYKGIQGCAKDRRGMNVGQPFSLSQAHLCRMLFCTWLMPDLILMFWILVLPFHPNFSL